MKSAVIKRVSETHAMIYLGDTIAPERASLIGSLSEKIRLEFAAGIIEVVPSYTSIMIEFNLLKMPYSTLEARLTELLVCFKQSSQQKQQKIIELPVYYHPDVAPDLQTLAEAKNLSVQQVIDIHCQSDYTVCTIGFSPGFAFLGSVDQRIVMPRHASPRLKIPAGSVGIADRQTAVYPDDSPGGWQIIGNCPITLFNPERDPMMSFSVGDKVRFKSVSLEEFTQQGGQICPNWK
ncbi:MAG TPA: 5-oxoprolinase subunit PxpB [Psychromonas sp.]